MKIKKLISVLLALSIISGLSTICFATDDAVEVMQAEIYMLEIETPPMNFSNQGNNCYHETSRMAVVKITFGEQAVRMAESVEITDQTGYTTCDEFHFVEEEHTLYFRTGYVDTKSRTFRIPESTVFDSNGNGNKGMLVTTKNITKYKITRTETCFQDKLTGDCCYKVGGNVCYTCNGDLSFDVYVDGELFESNVTSCEIPIEQGGHSIWLSFCGCLHRSDYSGRVEEEYNYADYVAYDALKGAATIADIGGLVVTPVALLAIPVIGPLLSALSVFLVPFYAIFALFSGTAQIIAAPITAVGN